MDDNRILLRDLYRILHDGPENRKAGICANVSVPIPHKYFKSWPEFSGDLTFPVPAPHTWLETPASAYGEVWFKWSRRFAYGRARRRLLLHLIDCVTEEIRLADEADFDQFVEALSCSPS